VKEHFLPQANLHPFGWADASLTGLMLASQDKSSYNNNDRAHPGLPGQRQPLFDSCLTSTTEGAGDSTSVDAS
jgi:hypothetical protein